MDLGPMLCQSPAQRGQGQRLIQLPAPMPAPDAARLGSLRARAWRMDASPRRMPAWVASWLLRRCGWTSA